MANYKEVDETLALVNDLATTEQIQNLLRTRREHKDVRITGENKEQIVDRNLRQAVESRAIDIERVFDLIRDAEENGNQHILYYKVRSKDIADALAFDSLAPRVFGAKWREHLDENYPQVRLRPNDFMTSDFRSLPKKPRDWIWKIYGEIEVWRTTDKERSEGGGVWRFYLPERLRIVLLARWNSPNLLEIRVQRSDSRRRIEGWHNTVWETLKPHIVRSQFTRWELPDAMKSLVGEQQKNKTVYTFSDAEVTDSLGNHATFEAEVETGDLFSSLEVRQSLQGFIKGNSDFDGLTVSWLHQKKTNVPSKDTRTILGVRQSQSLRGSPTASSNEIVIPAHCSAEDLEYVTTQLRSFNK